MDNYSFSTNILLPLSSIINLEEINEEDNIIYHKISTKNQKTLLQNYSLNFNNLSVIDLNGCEQVLREKYNKMIILPIFFWKIFFENVSYNILIFYNSNILRHQ